MGWTMHSSWAKRAKRVRSKIHCGRNFLRLADLANIPAWLPVLSKHGPSLLGSWLGQKKRSLWLRTLASSWLSSTAVLTHPQANIPMGHHMKNPSFSELANCARLISKLLRHQDSQQNGAVLIDG